MLSADSCSAKIHTRVQRETGPETIQILVQHRRQSATPPTMSCFSINSIRNTFVNQIFSEKIFSISLWR